MAVTTVGGSRARSAASTLPTNFQPAGNLMKTTPVGGEQGKPGRLADL
jgi:hypothetical protein